MVKKLLINSLVIFCIILSVNITAFSSTTEAQNDSKSDKGSIFLRELLLAHRMLANSKQSDPDNSKIAKSIVLIGQKKYEIVSFEFKNTLGTPAEETFVHKYPAVPLSTFFQPAGGSELPSNPSANGRLVPFVVM